MTAELDAMTVARPTIRSIRSWRPEWAAYGASVWSLLYGALGLAWALGGAGFPFGTENDPNAVISVLASVRSETAAPVIAGLGLVGALVALAMARMRVRGIPGLLLLAFAWSATAALLLVIPDFRVLVVAGYAPVFLVGAPFHWPPVSFLEAVPWPVINQFVLIAGGLLWGATALIYQRRTRGACEQCGRSDVAGWTSPSAAARWGKVAVSIAVIVPVFYAATRWAWALGIPLGISNELLREGQAGRQWWGGAGLASVAVCGALLTLGLVQRWGEIFPHWMPGLGGKSVPPALAIVPATLVSILVTTAGLMFARLTHFGGIGEIFPFVGRENWATIAPELLWPVWGAALGAAALAYYYRRRGRCGSCDRR